MSLIKQPKIWAFILCFASPSGFAEGREIHLLLQAGSYSFTSERPGRDTEKISGFGSYSLLVSTPLNSQVSVQGGLTYLASEGFGGDTATGIDLGLRYHPLMSASRKNLQVDGIVLEYGTRFRPYLGFFLRQRQFLTTLTTTYFGPGINVGVDWKIGTHLFLNAEIKYDRLLGPSEAIATQSNLLLGIGWDL